ncbi:hypothetical protein [Enterococcus sp. AZ103]|uniref:hypothetical protein n=1 Tax=Enterococcus sp. AZ103 TaxID=2774628 RepID=UPI003F27063A
MIKLKHLSRYYRKEKNYSKSEARKLAEKTQPSLEAAENIYLSIYDETQPKFYEKSSKEKKWYAYQWVSLIIFAIYFLIVLRNGFFTRTASFSHFFLLVLAGNLYNAIRVNLKINQMLHEQRIAAVLESDLIVNEKLADVEKLKKRIFRQEQKGNELRLAREKQARELEIVKKQNKKETSKDK